MAMNVLGRALLTLSGLRDYGSHKIEPRQRDRDAVAELQRQLRRLQESGAGAEKQLTALTRRYEKVVEKHARLIEQQKTRLWELRERIEALESNRVDGRVTALERARQDDQAERVRAAISDLEILFPLPSLAAHVAAVIERSPLIQEPFPHVVLDDILPERLHAILYEARPPRGCWRAVQVGRENWTIGADVGPVRTEVAWRFMDAVIAPRILIPALTTLFQDYLDAMDPRFTKGGIKKRRRATIYEQSGGRLMLRRPGYEFEPHLDPLRALLTGLLYFGTPDNGHEHGTKLFRINGAIPETHEGIYYPLREGASCELVKTIPPRPNSMLVFASRVGIHGADIPVDAQPPTLERYTYQFYIGKVPHPKQ
jgi:hypothetical protein